MTLVVIPSRMASTRLPNKPLALIAARAMAKDPADRYATAADMAGALRGIDLGDDAVPAVVRDPTPPAGVVGSFGQT